MTDEREAASPEPEDHEPAAPSNAGPPDAGPSNAGPSRPALTVAPLLSLVGLLLVSMLTFGAYRILTPTLADQPEATPTPTEAPTLPPGKTAAPTPTPTPFVNPVISIPGQLVYAKNGALWIQSGTSAHQLTQSVNGSVASQPAFSPDGQWIYYIDTRITKGTWYDLDQGGAITRFTLNYPVLCRIHPDGTGKKDVLSSLIRQGSLRVNFFLRQPSIATAGTVAAVASDGPFGPGTSDVAIHYVNLTTGKLGPALNLTENSPLGLSDPEFSPNGKYLAYTMEGRSGKVGAPSIWILGGGQARKLAQGYRAASWSPDGKFIAATKVSGNNLDVVVLDAATGRQVAQVTNDGYSWGPVWSPDGEELVYMHLIGSVTELNMVYISGSAPQFSFRIEANLTDYSGVDGVSTPAWYIPGYGPVVTPSPSPSASGPVPASSAPVGSGSPSAAPAVSSSPS